VNLSNDADQEYFADAITDDLTTDLSRLRGSFGIARTTAFTYKGKPVDVKQIGRDLGVHYVLEGSVRRLGDRVQVNVQLIDTKTGSHVWADHFDTDRRDLVQAQSETTSRLARTLGTELFSDVGRRIEQDHDANPDARDLINHARALIRQSNSAAVNREDLNLLEQRSPWTPRQPRKASNRRNSGGWHCQSVQQKRAPDEDGASEYAEGTTKGEAVTRGDRSGYRGD